MFIATTTKCIPVVLHRCLILSHLDQDILAESGEGVLEAVKGDVVALADGATHSVTHLIGALPFTLLTHTVGNTPVLV